MPARRNGIRGTRKRCGIRLRALMVRCRGSGCTSWPRRTGTTGWTTAFLHLLTAGTVLQEKLAGYLESQKMGRNLRLLHLHSTSSSCQRRSPVGIMLAISGQTQRAVTVAIQYSRFCERTARTSAGQGLPRRGGPALGSESPLKGKGADLPYRPEGLDPEGTATRPTALGTILAGEKRSRWPKAWGQGSVILPTARGVM